MQVRLAIKGGEYNIGDGGEYGAGAVKKGPNFVCGKIMG